MARENSVCQYTIRDFGIIEIQDLRKYIRFTDFEYVKTDGGLCYYLGVPLISDGKYAIGSHCVLDCNEEKRLSDNQINQLKIIANEVMTHLELHKKTLNFKN